MICRVGGDVLISQLSGNIVGLSWRYFGAWVEDGHGRFAHYDLKIVWSVMGVNWFYFIAMRVFIKIQKNDSFRTIDFL